ncbi:unnamed protein product, partial [uncultured virus]
VLAIGKINDGWIGYEVFAVALSRMNAINFWCMLMYHILAINFP